ncbi:tRNA uridine-5-carboxymethylaminomethyl(34) synthesis GTPase MnmE [bacterium C-53]|nr:tRNA uridine-5-carboxymethylaminomethyl(34) synthesis GTPase MnmE [Lachnospiraceae bacterium]NBI03105.1 tRNA uridine-5-carboxymethylaminomethyl(34) synthesis GTPase MnmE [Lachnospiraceae bacterium]RKJ10712.1 tRNA uridine-5-carboxymethylaminomethyl(34) synthesis GTPase MnmE [bacterium C-53]
MVSGDTIAAIATAMSQSGIGIVRVSGENAISIVNKIYRSKSGKKTLNHVESHTIHYGYIYDEDEMVDEVMVMVMKGPRSYTAEDTVEIDCHGGVLVVRRILETVIKNGARCAQPGEFTKRAFLNGRIDLSKAEAVIDIIHSKNEFALKNSVNQLKGSVYEKIKDIREKIIYEIAFIESALDDPEHISLDGYNDEIEEKIVDLQKETKKLYENAENGKMLKEGIKTVIVGKPNAGKSSLLNKLIGEERAIVTDIAGTTRDILEETIFLNGLGLNIIDTAGIRTTEDIVEKIGVEKAKKYANDADLIIYVVDALVPLDANDEDIIQMILDKNVIVLLNKTDMHPVITEESLKARLDKPVLSISAKENIGIDILEDTIKNMFFHGRINMNEEVFITNVRQKEAIGRADESLRMVLQSIRDGMPEDFYSIDLMSAYSSLGEVIGVEVGEDLVNKIFSDFCMGK